MENCAVILVFTLGISLSWLNTYTLLNKTSLETVMVSGGNPWGLTYERNGDARRLAWGCKLRI